jgi:hypothetical protein
LPKLERFGAIDLGGKPRRSAQPARIRPVELEGDSVLDGRLAPFALGQKLITGGGKTIGPVEFDQMIGNPSANGQRN